VRVNENQDNLSLHLEHIIKALVGNRKMFIRYQDIDQTKEARAISIFPLTLVQYRDDLYLCAYKNEMKDENLRHYKVSRILEIMESTEGFRYPSISRWNPREHFKNNSGIFVGNEKRAKFRVYGNSKKLLSEKSFFNSKLLERTRDFDEYECNYSNVEEFIGFLFIYGQDIEIVSDASLKKSFREKAQKILNRNS